LKLKLSDIKELIEKRKIESIYASIDLLEKRIEVAVILKWLCIAVFVLYDFIFSISIGLPMKLIQIDPLTVKEGLMVILLGQTILMYAIITIPFLILAVMFKSAIQYYNLLIYMKRQE
jgi:hypothetical protein